ncbi:MAG: hypothetical protein ACKVQS_13405 [Fimbriimonadaceae bacterium]
MSKIVSLSLSSIALLFFSGCGDSGPKIVEVAGRATYQQKPVQRILVTFSPETGRPSVSSLTDADGKFELTYEGTRKGAQVGTHTVTIEYYPTDPGEEQDIVEGKKKRPAAVEAILKKYGSGKEKKTVEIKQAVKDLDLQLD